jgi:hypothetical protein
MITRRQALLSADLLPRCIVGKQQMEIPSVIIVRWIVWIIGLTVISLITFLERIMQITSVFYVCLL